MAPNLRNGILIAAFAALGLTAVAGWTRKPALPSASAFASPAYYQPAQNAYGQPAPYSTAYPNAAYPNAAAPAYGEAVRETAYPANYSPCVEPQGYSSRSRDGVVYGPATREVPAYRERVVRTSYVEPRREYREYVVHRGRSTKKSVAIVAGSSGVGAAIGALAGGGRGAGIGALAGGGAGFIYDRLTHNHVN